MTQEYIGANPPAPPFPGYDYLPKAPNYPPADFPQYTMRDNYPRTWLNRAPVAIAAKTYKKANFLITNAAFFKIANANPNRIAIILTCGNNGDVFIDDQPSPSNTQFAFIMGSSRQYMLLTAEWWGNFVIKDIWCQSGAASQNLGIIEVFLEPFDPRVTQGLFP